MRKGYVQSCIEINTLLNYKASKIEMEGLSIEGSGTREPVCSNILLYCNLKVYF
jgi:hypothetical protein